MVQPQFIRSTKVRIIASLIISMSKFIVPDKPKYMNRISKVNKGLKATGGRVSKTT